MALLTRSNPVGIDIPIAGFQKFLYNQVKAKWGITDDFKYTCYDRAYRELIDTGYAPRYMVPNAQSVLEWVTCTIDDTTDWVVSFFSVPDQIQEIENRTSVAKVSLIFQVNLGTADNPTIKPAITGHRADEEVRNDIEQICFTPRFGFELAGFETGFENVFKDYKGLMTEDRKNIADLHPRHVFKINFNLEYALEDCTNPVPNLF